MATKSEYTGLVKVLQEHPPLQG
uniref:Uncharacterized protein n=1 Tax=Arundo donax TaxID=35708 RepID=A0A0A9F9P1_ARUDO